ncbi:hypothetical protein Nepgr_010980 [Nepenthes gracilis]|uniref:Uncharacterized protein n=1 Tax=Nepenthes gracilis TaxID=150966 RepID=A0AAD3SD96_NEPGR|nr:hypothetical protein Nepgr_010980 [Nepenthes gracilis]
MNSASLTCLPDPTIHFPVNLPNRLLPLLTLRRHSLSVSSRCILRFRVSLSSISLTASLSVLPPSIGSPSFELARALIQLSASSIFLLSLGVFGFSCRAFAHTSAICAAGSSPTILEERTEGNRWGKTNFENVEDKELNEAFESWKSKTFALTVPLRIVALLGSVPSSWIKDFVQSHGRRLKLSFEVRADLEKIFSELLVPFSKGNTDSRSAITADLVTIGDSWLNLAISNALIEPIQMADDKVWFGVLTDKWKVYLCRNSNGKLDPNGKIWGVPYRWGSMVIMYKKSKFDKYGLHPIKDWEDLWRPELAGRISMVDSAREVVGAVLKYMGASYNTNNIDAQVPGGMNSVQQNLVLLAKQVRLFDSKHYLKAFGVGDVWVAVGWSSDILPAAKRMSGVAVIIPKSGASLWADLWAVPATARCAARKVGGRSRGPSPLIHQWLDFCLQAAREVPFKREVVPGSSPYLLERIPSPEVSKELVVECMPKLETNLIAGVPPPEILVKCEFLEPLSEATVSDYQLLISSIKQKPGHYLIQRIRQNILTMVQILFAWVDVNKAQSNGGGASS